MQFDGFIVCVIVTAKTPVVLYRSGKQKGKVKSGGELSKVLETPTFLLNSAVQGLQNEEQAAKIALDIAFSKNFHNSLIALGYTEIDWNVHCVRTS